MCCHCSGGRRGNGTADGSTPEAKPAATKQKVKPQAAKVEQPAEDEIPF